MILSNLQSKSRELMTGCPNSAIEKLALFSQDVLYNKKDFGNFVGLTIGVAGILVGLQTYDSLAENKTLETLDLVILAIFILEMALKILAEGKKPWLYFTGPEWKWNWFDFLIVFMSLPFWSSIFSGGSVAVLRLFRLARLTKLFRKIPQLQMILSGLSGGMVSILYILLLLAIVFYLYSVIGVYAFGANDPWHFSTLPRSFLSLFRAATLDNWMELTLMNTLGCKTYPGIYQDGSGNTTDSASPVCTDPKPQYVIGPLYWISFIVINSLVMMSLFVGTVTLSMSESVKQMRRQGIEENSRLLRQKQMEKLGLKDDNDDSKKDDDTPLTMKEKVMEYVEMALYPFKYTFTKIVNGLGELGMFDTPEEVEKEKKNLARMLGKAWSNTAPPPDDPASSDLKSIARKLEEEAEDMDEDTDSLSMSSSGSSPPSPEKQLSISHISPLKEKAGCNGNLSTPEEQHPPTMDEDDKSWFQKSGRKSDKGTARSFEKINEKNRLVDYCNAQFINSMIYDAHFRKKTLAQLNKKISRQASRILENSAFSNFITVMILLAGAMVGLETDEYTAVHAEMELYVIDQVILGIFSIEIVLKMVATRGKPLKIFKSRWNSFDVVIVIFSYALGGDMVTMLRLLRLVRVLRLVRALPELQMIIEALLGGLSSIGYIGVIMLIVYYMFAILGVMLYATNDPVHFGTLHTAMITLFRVSTLDGWANIMYTQAYGCRRVISDENTCEHSQSFGVLAVVYFMIFIVIATMILLSLFIGVITMSMDEAKLRRSNELDTANRLRKVVTEQKVAHEEIEVFSKLFDTLDLDGSGFVDVAELKIGLNLIGKFPSDEEIFEMLSKLDENASGSVDFAEFVCFLLYVRQEDRNKEAESVPALDIPPPSVPMPEGDAEEEEVKEKNDAESKESNYQGSLTDHVIWVGNHAMERLAAFKASFRRRIHPEDASVAEVEPKAES